MEDIDFAQEYKKFGKHVRKLRKRIPSVDYEGRSISQQELTDRTSLISRKTLGEIESGKTNPEFSTLLVLCKLLQVSPKELLDY